MGKPVRVTRGWGWQAEELVHFGRAWEAARVWTEGAVRRMPQAALNLFLKTRPQSPAIGLDAECERRKGDRMALGLGFVAFVCLFFG